MSRTRCWSLLVVWFATWLAGHGAIAATTPVPPSVDPVVERAFLRDAGGRLGVQDLATQSFAPFDGVLSLGNSDIVTWLRLTLRPPPSGDWVLLIQPTLVQEALVYEPQVGGGWNVQTLGSRFAHARRLNRDLNLVAPLSLGPGSAPQVVYVRVHTPTSLLQVRVVTAETARTLETRTHLAIGLYAGFCTTLVLLATGCWLATREPIWFWGALLEIVHLLLPLAQLGFVGKYLLPDAVGLVDRWVMTAGFSVLTSVTWFSGWFLTLFKAPRWCLVPYAIGVAAFPVMVGTMLAGHPGPALALSNLLVLVIASWGLVVAFFVRPEDGVLRWLWRGLSLAICLYTLYWVSPFVGYARSTALSLYPSFPSNMSSAIVTMLLAARYTQLRSRSLRAAEDALRASDRHLVQERAEHQQTSSFLSMLVHEVRNPLALVHAMTRRIAHCGSPRAVSEALALIDRCADDINAVVERSVEADRLDRGHVRARPMAEDAAERLRDWLALHRDRSRVDADLPGPMVATFDAGLWLSMVRNLVENALKYGPPDGRVALRLRESGDFFEVDVANVEGPIGRPDPRHLFTKYYRSPLTEGISGTGLGLYWVLHLSRRLGGDLLHLPPGPDGEIVFRLTLPLDDDPGATP